MAKLKRQPGCSVRNCCGACPIECLDGMLTEINPIGVDLVLADLPDPLYLLWQRGFGKVIIKISGLSTLEGTYTIEGCPIGLTNGITETLDVSGLTHEFLNVDGSDCVDPSPMFPYTLDSLVLDATYTWQVGVIGFDLDYTVGLSDGLSSFSFTFRLTWMRPNPANLGAFDCVGGTLPRYVGHTGDSIEELTTCPTISPPLDDNSTYAWLF